MPALALSLDVTDRTALVVGAGSVAARKARKLAAAGARVRLVAPEAGPDAEALVAAGAATWDARAVRLPDDLVGAFLVVAATGDAAVNDAVVDAARAAGALVNAAHDPGRGDVTFPATVQRGELTVAVSTGSLAPALARAVATHLGGALDDAWAALVAVGAAVRAHLRARGEPGTREAWERFAGPATLVALRAGDEAALDGLLAASFGAGCTWAALGLPRPGALLADPTAAAAAPLTPHPGRAP